MPFVLGAAGTAGRRKLIHIDGDSAARAARLE